MDDLNKDGTRSEWTDSYEKWLPSLLAQIELAADRSEQLEREWKELAETLSSLRRLSNWLGLAIEEHRAKLGVRLEFRSELEIKPEDSPDLARVKRSTSALGEMKHTLGQIDTRMNGVRRG